MSQRRAKTDSVVAESDRPSIRGARRIGLRLRAVFKVSEPGDLDAVLVNGLIAGYVALACVGTVEALLLQNPAAWVQPIATAALMMWAWLAKRRGNPRPIPLLLVSATLAAAFLVISSWLDLPQDATNSSPIVMIVGSGAMALVAGGRRPIRAGAYVMLLAAASVWAVQVALDERTPARLADVASSIIVIVAAYYLIRTVRAAYDTGSSRYTGLIETAPVAVLEADLSTIVRPDSYGQKQLIRDLNPRARRLLGLGTTDPQTLFFSDIEEPFRRFLTDVVVAKAITGEQVVSYGGRSMIVSWKSLNRTFNRVIFSAVDITAQRQAEESLAEQVRGRDQFIATVSHELRTPLTGILGLLEVLTTGEVPQEESSELMLMALGQTRDMADIVQDLLVAARASSGALVMKIEETRLDEIVSGVLASLAHDIEIEIGATSTVMADPVRARQIVRNLVTNAIRYGGPRRRVVVGHTGCAATIEVRDNGPELPADFQARMFEPYERSPQSDLPTESVGLGLTVARTLARLMDGDLTYHHDGIESAFSLSLPKTAIVTAA